MTEFDFIKKLCINKLKFAIENNDVKCIEKCKKLLLNFNDRMFFTKIDLFLSYEILIFIGVSYNDLVNVYSGLIDFKKIYNIN